MIEMSEWHNLKRVHYLTFPN